MAEPANSSARETIFASIRTHLERSRPKDRLFAPHGGTRPTIATSMEKPPDKLSDQFSLNVRLVGGACVVGSAELAAEYISEFTAARGIETASISDSFLVRELLVSVPRLSFSQDVSRSELFNSPVGVSEAQWGIAETGTLVLESSVEQHRLVSLVPPVHICILRADRIRRTMAEVLELTSAELSPTVTLITGPSRTSDIELTLAIGVHGPGELHVLVIE